MCDYSLHAVSNRPAEVGDRLITTGFSFTATRGFCEVGKPRTAVCLLPGTELSFDEAPGDAWPRKLWDTIFTTKWSWKIRDRVGRFRQVNLNVLKAHHDAIEFSDGRIVLVTHMRPGQRATVLQLPANPGALSGTANTAPQSVDAQA
jgi:hypothetical protein